MPFGRRTVPPGGQPAAAPPEPPPQAAAPPLQPAAPEEVPRPTSLISAKIVHAAVELTNMLRAAYDSGGGRIHAETIIAAAAALAGEFAQRASGTPVQPGKPGFVFSDGTNDVLFEGAEHGRPTVWESLLQAARSAGLSRDQMPDPMQLFEQVAAAVGGSNFPPLTVPPQNYPHEYSPNACVRLRLKVVAIADQFDLSRRDIPIALGMTIAGLIGMTKDVLAPEIGVRLAAEVAFGVAKMVPLSEPIG